MSKVRWGVLGLSILVFCVALAGASEVKSDNDQDVRSEYLQAQQRVMEILQRLEEIREKAIAERPGLREKQKQFQQLVRAKLVATDLISTSDLDRIQEIQRLYQSEEISQAEKQALNEEFRQLSSAFKLAQYTIMEDEKVQEVSQAYQTAVMEAMKDQDPETRKLIDEFDVLQARLQIMQSPGFAAGGGNVTQTQE